MLLILCDAVFIIQNPLADLVRVQSWKVFEVRQHNTYAYWKVQTSAPFLGHTDGLKICFSYFNRQRWVEEEKYSL